MVSLHDVFNTILPLFRIYQFLVTVTWNKWFRGNWLAMSHDAFVQNIVNIYERDTTNRIWVRNNKQRCDKRRRARPSLGWCNALTRVRLLNGNNWGTRRKMTQKSWNIGHVPPHRSSAKKWLKRTIFSCKIFSFPGSHFRVKPSSYKTDERKFHI